MRPAVRSVLAAAAAGLGLLATSIAPAHATTRSTDCLPSAYSAIWTAESSDHAAQPFGDLNRDGRADLLQRNNCTGNLYYLPGDQTGAFLGGGWNTMTAFTRHGDLTGDGNEDLLARDRSGVLWLYPGNGHSSFGNRTSLGGGWNTMRLIRAVGDLNADGRGDLLATDNNGTLWLYPGNGHGSFGNRTQIGTAWNAIRSFVGVGDITGDGHSDLIASDTSNKFWRYPGNGRGGLTDRSPLPGVADYPDLVSVGDVLSVNGDHYSDVLGTGHMLSLLPGTAGGGLGSSWGGPNVTGTELF
ncbi:FG-GAP repeat domain-containing protein [Streptomyces violascens]|uniref:FG-GAP repeat domain-containing protein n=1 Tax=Streptomyces violascens TaxID=67381 RepID=UPI0036A0EE7C